MIKHLHILTFPLRKNPRPNYYFRHKSRNGVAFVSVYRFENGIRKADYKYDTCNK